MELHTTEENFRQLTFIQRATIRALQGFFYKLFTNILSIRKELSDGFKKVVDWNLESDDGHDHL